MKIKRSYRLVTQSNGEVADRLYQDWCNKYPFIPTHHSSFFDIIYRRVMEGNKKVKNGWRMISVSLIGISVFSLLFFLSGAKHYFTLIPTPILLFLGGFGVAMVKRCKPDYWDQQEVEKYTNTVCLLFWKLIEYKTNTSHPVFPEHDIKMAMYHYHSDHQLLVKDVDSMLVHLAFKVRSLEPVRDEGDRELMGARDKRLMIHGLTVALSLADKNPLTHFDRAITASEKAAKAPAS